MSTYKLNNQNNNNNDNNDFKKNNNIPDESQHIWLYFQVNFIKSLLSFMTFSHCQCDLEENRIIDVNKRFSKQ